MQTKPTQNNKIYECIAVDSHQQCTQWAVNENSHPLTKAEANILTAKILAFMVFVFVLKQIKKSI